MSDLFQYKALFAGLGGLLVLSLVFFIFSIFSVRKIRQEAEEDWAYQVSENMQDLRLNKEGYVRAFTKVHAPRKLKYLSGMLAALALLTLPAFALIERALHYLWILSGQSRVFEPPFLVWQFFVYFSILAVWISIASFFHRRYHRTSPGTMRDVLISEHEKFTPDKPLIVGPNPARLAATDYGENGREALRIVFEDALRLTRQANKSWQDTEFVYDQYSDGSDMVIQVFLPNEQGQYIHDIHPFFFPGKFARADDKPRHFLVLRVLPNPYKALEMVRTSGLDLIKSSGGKTERICSFSLPFLDIYMYRGN